MRIIFFVGLILLLSAGTATATTYYVRTDGNNSCLGTSNASYTDNTSCAWLTIARGLNATGAGAGDILRVQAGTYLNDSASIANEGNLTHPLRVIADGEVIMDGNATRSYSFFINQKHDIIIDGFIVQNYINVDANSAGITVLSSGTPSKNITITNNTIRNMTTKAVYMRNIAFAENITVSNNNIYNTSGIAGAELTHNSTIDNNEIHDLQTNAIGINLGGNYTTVSNNYLYNISGATSKAISTGRSNGMRYIGNRLDNAGVRGFRIGTGGAKNVTLESNIIINQGVPIDIYPDTEVTMTNNTVLNSTGWILQGPEYLIMRNNTLDDVSVVLFGISESNTSIPNNVTTFIFENNTMNNSIALSVSNVINGTIKNNIFKYGDNTTSIDERKSGVLLNYDGNSYQYGSENISIESNVFFNIKYGIIISNNTGKWVNNLVIKNNIFMNITNAIVNYSATNPNINYNMVYNNSSSAYINISESNTLYSDPLFIINGTDFHLQSQYNRWNGTAWVQDAQTSPAIGAGDPTSDNSLSPWGGIIEMGAYGNTAEASQGTPEVVTYSLSGYVTGISGVNVSNSTIGSNLTNVTGYYQIDNISNGTYVMTVSKTGYDTNTTSVTISGNTMQNFTLIESNYNNFTFSNVSTSSTSIYVGSQYNQISVDINDSDGYIANATVGITYNGIETNYTMIGGNDTWRYNFISGVPGTYIISGFYANDNSSGSNSSTQSITFYVVPQRQGGNSGAPVVTSTPASSITNVTNVSLLPLSIINKSKSPPVTSKQTKEIFSIVTLLMGVLIIFKGGTNKSVGQYKKEFVVIIGVILVGIAIYLNGGL